MKIGQKEWWIVDKDGELCSWWEVYAVFLTKEEAEEELPEWEEKYRNSGWSKNFPLRVAEIKIEEVTDE